MVCVSHNISSRTGCGNSATGPTTGAHVVKRPADIVYIRREQQRRAEQQKEQQRRAHQQMWSSGYHWMQQSKDKESTALIWIQIALAELHRLGHTPERIAHHLAQSLRLMPHLPKTPKDPKDPKDPTV